MRFLSILRNILDDLLILAGCALILVGVYQVRPVATWFVGGVMLIIFGILVGIVGKK